MARRAHGCAIAARRRLEVGGPRRGAMRGSAPFCGAGRAARAALSEAVEGDVDDARGLAGEAEAVLVRDDEGRVREGRVAAEELRREPFEERAQRPPAVDGDMVRAGDEWERAAAVADELESPRGVEHVHSDLELGRGPRELNRREVRVNRVVQNGHVRNLLRVVFQHVQVRQARDVALEDLVRVAVQNLPLALKAPRLERKVRRRLEGPDVKHLGRRRAARHPHRPSPRPKPAAAV
mmetsp:Transcript_10496/g.36395  ORF Transcript_10496/g.36395 Transcript_10496/m.36395 type:complete len:237 (-) Transcript_10496:11-721(-)